MLLDCPTRLRLRKKQLRLAHKQGLAIQRFCDNIQFHGLSVESGTPPSSSIPKPFLTSRQRLAVNLLAYQPLPYATKISLIVSIKQRTIFAVQKTVNALFLLYSVQKRYHCQPFKDYAITALYFTYIIIA